MYCSGDPEVEELQYQNLEPRKRKKKKKNLQGTEDIRECGARAWWGILDSWRELCGFWLLGFSSLSLSL